MKFIFKKMWGRALELYMVGVGLTFVFLCWTIFTGHAGIKDMPVPFDWGHYSVQALLMRYTFGWADFIVRFSILMIFAPFIFYLVAKGRCWLALIGIFSAWLFRGQNFTLSWQLIFNLGIIIGFYWQPITNRFNSLKAATRRKIKMMVGGAAIVTLAISYACVYVLSLLFHLWGDNHLSQPLQHIAYVWGNWNYDIWLYADKWTMGPLRIVLFFLWFPTLYWVVRRYEHGINKATYGVIELLGRNGLPVYAIHAFIVLAFKLYVIPQKTGFIENFVITGIALILLVLITIGYTKIKPIVKDFSRNLPWFSRTRLAG